MNTKYRVLHEIRTAAGSWRPTFQHFETAKAAQAYIDKLAPITTEFRNFTREELK